MAKIVDPDFLNQNVEITINVSTRRISLSETGNLTSDGVSGQAIYSFFKEEWINDFTLAKFPFPIEAVTESKFDIIGGWDWADQPTKNLSLKPSVLGKLSTTWSTVPVCPSSLCAAGNYPQQLHDLRIGDSLLR